jgi:glucose/arabinose dehydrogenase
LVGALKFTSIYRLVIDPATNKPISEERLFNDEMGRVRDVEQANDGSILVLSDAPNGGLYRISR